MSQQKSKLHLPSELVRRIESDSSMLKYKSAAYLDEAHKFRLGTRNWNHPWSPDSVHIFDNPLVGFTVEARRTSLHLAAAEGDVLYAHELLRLSATADAKDNNGITPLYLALSQAAAAKSGVPMHKLNGVGMRPIEREQHISRTAWVARVVIEQHADVNFSIDGLTPLHLACIAHSWDTIALLLKHGANPLPASSYFTSRVDRRRFSSLVKSIGRVQSRPPRVCPCWSGEIVENCHGKEEQAYPLEFLCICGSTKTYRRCCYSRKSYAIEVWDWKQERLIHNFDITCKAPEFAQETFRAVKECVKETDKLRQLLGEQRATSMYSIVNSNQSNLVKEQLLKRSRFLLEKGLIDPAFAYALERVDFAPKPHGRNHSRILCQSMQLRWNNLIDEYISLESDQRPKEDIEMAAKIGTWNGALIRTCEGFDCGKIEGRDVSSLKLCSRCKIAVYCCSECQRSAWPAHKIECHSEGQREQALPSQKSMQMYHEALFAQMPGVVTAHSEALSEMRASLTQDSNFTPPA